MKSTKTAMHKLCNKAALCVITVFMCMNLSIAIGECANLQVKDEISNLSFSYDGKKILFNRCRENVCQIQVYDLESGELAAFQSPINVRWTMARQSYDGKRIVFSVIPIDHSELDYANMQIAVMDADGKNYREVTTGPGAKLSPVFSHSGTKVLYARAAFIRKQGNNNFSQFDAWEVDLNTGIQTQLTFFKYYFMGSLTYFPEDEHFIYFGNKPESFPGLDLPVGNHKLAQEMIMQEREKKQVNINGVIVMKKGDALPQGQYNPNMFISFPAFRLLLSKDGYRLIGVYMDGRIYLFSTDGNHKLIGAGPSINSAAISPDGDLVGMIACNIHIHILTVQDRKRKVILYLPTAPRSIEGWESAYPQSESLYKMIPEKPSRILNQ